MAKLNVARRNIVEHSIAKDIVKGILFTNVFTCLANNHAQFGLPVDLFGDGWINYDGAIGTIGGRCRLGKNHRRLCLCRCDTTCCV